MVKVESIGNPICHIAECPVWNDTDKALYWTDILEKRIWKYCPPSGAVQIEWEGDLMVGGFAFTKTNDLVMCTHEGVYRLSRPDGDGPSQPELLFDIPMANDERFNDITTDPRGRIFAGTLTKRRAGGTLYRLQNGEAPTPVLKDIGASNGMTFSPDLRYFYHTDSEARTITRYDYDPETGDIEGPCVVYQGLPANGFPT